MERLYSFLLVLTCALSVGAAAQEPARLETATDVAAVAIDIGDLRAEVQKLLDEHRVPGASIALVDRDRTLWVGGVGKADLAAGVEATGDHLFRVGSISKSFTALAVMRAVEDGLVDLETPVRDLVPEVEFTNPWADSHPVTVAMVMEHTAGFDDIHFREYAKVDDPDMTLAAGLAFGPSSRRSRWVPGTHMSYCNSGPPIAAYIVEKVTGKSFEDYVREQVFDPLGMATATFFLPLEPGLMAKGYEDDGVTEAHYDHITIRPSGALNASANDMARYLRMMINRGTLDGVRVLAPETIERMETPTTTLAARAGHDFGYGLGNYATIVNGHRFQGHNGGITGFAATSAYSADLGIGYFVAVNRPSGGALRGIGALVGELLTGTVDKPQAPAAALTEGELREIAGFYQDVTPRQQLAYVWARFLGSVQQVDLEDGKLSIKGVPGGEARELIPVTASSFRFEDEPEATVFRVAGAAGDVFLQQGLGTNSRKVSGAWLFIQYAAAMLVVALLLSAVLFALVWAPLKVFGKWKRLPLRTVLIPLLAALSPCAVFVLPVILAANVVQALGTLSAASVTIFVGSFVFAALTAWSLYVAYRSYAVDMSRAVRLHATLVSLACAALLLYLGAHGVIGIRTWAF